MKIHFASVVIMVVLIASASAQEPVEDVNAMVSIVLSPGLLQGGLSVLEFTARSGNLGRASNLMFATNKKLPVSTMVIVYGRDDLVLREVELKPEDLVFENRHLAQYIVSVPVPVEWVRRVEVGAGSGR